MSKIHLNINDLYTFATCPYKYHLSKSSNIDNSSFIGDEDLLLGTTIKEAFLKYMFLYKTAFKVKHKEIAREFGLSWIKAKKSYTDLGLNYTDNIDKITGAYDSLHYFKEVCSRENEVALINMPYIKVLKECIVKDVVDLAIIKPVKKSKATQLEIIIVDTDIQSPSRTNFISRSRAAMQEIFVKRECIGHNNIIVKTSIVNLYKNKIIPITLMKEHRVNYKKHINSIALAIKSNCSYPNPNKNICKRCMFQNKCVWSSKL